MIISMKNWERLTLAEMEEFVRGSRTAILAVQEQEAVYRFLEMLLKAQGYRRLKKSDKGIVRRFAIKVLGLSRAQVTRLICQWMRNHSIQKQPVRRTRFARRYTAEDVALLADVDAAHEDLSGPAIRHVLHREFTAYGKAAYERLAGISVSHIYNLRHSERYRQSRVRMHHTQARGVSIAERRKPDPQGKPGYLRVDTVHQGQHDGQPGIYHINAVDTVTQWQVIGCVETICERDLIPVLEAMFHQFPFRILGFHSDNGSEFLNHRVEKMLNKLLVEFTKSRAYRTTDNALVEGKNGAVVRKHMGYGAIGAEHAAAFQKFYTAYFNPYLNYHRPCGFADIQTRARGHKRRVYHSDDYQTPYEKLISLADWQQYLKDGVTVEFLRDQAQQMSDTEAARRMQKAKLALLAKSRGKQ
jgi:transposase InsO family protein